MLRQTDRELHFFNEKLSFIYEILADGQLALLYAGERLSEEDSHLYIRQEAPRALTAMRGALDSTLSHEQCKLVYPPYNTSRYRPAPFVLEDERGSEIQNFRFERAFLTEKETDESGLPFARASADDSETLILQFIEERTHCELRIEQTLYKDLALWTQRVRLRRLPDAPPASRLRIKKLLSIHFELEDADFTWTQFCGAWTRERCPRSALLHPGFQGIESLRGSSSSEFHPSLLLERPGSDEEKGEGFAFSLLYSGNFLAQIEVSSFEDAAVQMGIHPQSFSCTLSPGEEFLSPEVVAAYSRTGRAALSHLLHHFLCAKLMPAPHADRLRPVLLNNWEGTYMNFNEDILLEMAAEARNLGIELFVLDDGWFGQRSDDRRGLGDWYVQTRKIPSGLAGLSEKIHALGLQFGIWIEPEMVNADSDLYRSRPDYVLADPLYEPAHSRYQLVLDFSRDEVIEAVWSQLEASFKGVEIDYIKWDMNRYLSDVFSPVWPPEEQGLLRHRYVLGVYKLYRRLRARFPLALFESCASGGARFDYGLFAFAPQAWCSDNTDAGERLLIQYGSSFFFPPRAQGAHVSAVPNHQTGRTVSLATRAAVAYWGAFGYELDPRALSEEEKREISSQIRFYKAWRDVFQQGLFYRLRSPFESNSAAWMSVLGDRAAILYYEQRRHSNLAWRKLKVRGLDAAALYRVRLETLDLELGVFRGESLMKLGLPMREAWFERLRGDDLTLLFTCSSPD